MKISLSLFFITLSFSMAFAQPKFTNLIECYVPTGNAIRGSYELNENPTVIVRVDEKQSYSILRNGKSMGSFQLSETKFNRIFNRDTWPHYSLAELIISSEIGEGQTLNGKVVVGKWASLTSENRVSTTNNSLNDLLCTNPPSHLL